MTMNNDQTVTFIKIPTDEYGNYKYSYESIKDLFEQYKAIFSNQTIVIIPQDVQIWENVDIETLKSTRKLFDDIIKKKEKQEVE